MDVFGIKDGTAGNAKAVSAIQLAIRFLKAIF